jgi:glycosyltransferase involved in cell wall biosynthesis
MESFSGRYSFTAILSNHNHQEYLERIWSLLIGQTRKFDEILIVDDASTDSSVDLLRKITSAHSNVRLIELKKNVGVNEAVNIALREASSEYVYIFSADDEYSLEIIEQCENILQASGSLSMISGNAGAFSVSEGWSREFMLPIVGGSPVSWNGEKVIQLARDYAFTFFGGANMMKKSFILEVGGMREKLRWHADWFLYLVLALRYEPIAAVPKFFVKMRVSDSQYSAARFNWRRESLVFEALLDLLCGEFSDLYPAFKKGALLPLYPWQALFWFLGSARKRAFLTPLLVWRLLSYDIFRCFGKSIPPQIKNIIRKFLRV